MKDFGTASAIQKFAMKYPRSLYLNLSEFMRKKREKMVGTQLWQKLEDLIYVVC